MIAMRSRHFLVVILFQSLVIFGAQQPTIKRTKSDFRAYAIARQQLKLARENNILIAKNNSVLAHLLEAMTRANVLAAEQVKAAQEQNKIHLELLRMQQSASHDQSGDFKSEPSSPISSCATPNPLGRSMSGNAHHRLAAAAHETARLAMMASAVQSSRVSLSASTPNLQSLSSTTRKKKRSGPSLPTVLSPVNAELEAAAAESVSAPAASSATFLSPNASIILAHANEQPQGNGASAAAAAGAALRIQVTPVKDE